MITKKRRFGVSPKLQQGLSDTINIVENHSGTYRNVVLPLTRLELDPENPRHLKITQADIATGLNKSDPDYAEKQAELTNLQTLANSITNQGLIHPIVVYKSDEHYRVVAGHRRSLAAMLAGKKEIEARVFSESPKAFALKSIQWVENIQREDLSLDKKLANIQALIEAYQQEHVVTKMTAAALGEITQLSRPQASAYLNALSAPEDVQAAIKSSQLTSVDKAAVIAGIKDADLRAQALRLSGQGCSLAQLRTLAANQRKTKVTAALSKPKRGRVASRINMGFTKQSEVVKTLVEAVVQQPRYQNLAPKFTQVNWQDYQAATQAFRDLITTLETKAEDTIK